ncbi:MAG: thymidine phosphorylase [Actinobacteria bacterium]|nr:thymidine phosphorylase [Actinomycetota bacterium]
MANTPASKERLTVAELIALKRDGLAFTDQMIEDVVEGITNTTFSDAQVGALAMAITIRGMTTNETIRLTDAMRRSGITLKWNLDGPVTDKHSTGGVGDTVSLMLAPMLAACGAFVPMISGRGLGHTGGTCDKVEAIPGYLTAPSRDEFQRIVKKIGCAIIGQTDDLAPADRRLYKIRDVTATVESIPLICASILSKKLAAGIDVLVMDVKTGGGAFMKTLETSRQLATTVTDVAVGDGLRCNALVTDMDQPLASVAGNGLEVRETIDYLLGRRQKRLHQVVLALGARALVEAGLAADISAATTRLERTLHDGTATEKFAKMVAALGGPTDFVESPDEYLQPAPFITDVKATQSGWVQHVDTKHVGITVVRLGGGRKQPGEAIDLRVGITSIPSVGDRIEVGQTISTVHAADENSAHDATRRMATAIQIADQPIAARQPIFDY